MLMIWRHRQAIYVCIHAILFPKMEITSHTQRKELDVFFRSRGK